MPENYQHAYSIPDEPDKVLKDAAGFGKVPLPSESFGTLPNGSEPFRTVRNDSESFRSVPHGGHPQGSERRENHTLTVREAVRLFEAAGVARTERSIVNWCQPNRTGIARLDGYYDPNERKYYLTPQSVELAIAEEQAKAAKVNQPSEPFGTVPNTAESFRRVPNDSGRPQGLPNGAESREVRELEHELRDLQITNKAKDIVIEQMQQERAGFFDQVISANRKVGELEARLLQLESARQMSHEKSMNGEIAD